VKFSSPDSPQSTPLDADLHSENCQTDKHRQGVVQEQVRPVTEYRGRSPRRQAIQSRAPAGAAWTRAALPCYD